MVVVIKCGWKLPLMWSCNPNILHSPLYISDLNALLFLYCKFLYLRWNKVSSTKKISWYNSRRTFISVSIKIVKPTAIFSNFKCKYFNRNYILVESPFAAKFYLLWAFYNSNETEKICAIITFFQPFYRGLAYMLCILTSKWVLQTLFCKCDVPSSEETSFNHICENIA